MVEVTCIFAALAFTAANVMKIIYFIKERNRSFSWDLYTQLDPEYLEDDWDFRISKQALFLSSGFLNAFAWIVFAVPVIQMGWLLSKQGTQNINLNTAIIMLSIGGSLTEWLSSLFWLGMNIASKVIVKNFNLNSWYRADVESNMAQSGGNGDGIGWKTLEVNHIASSGFIWFTDAFEWLCLTGIFFFTFLSVRRWRQTDRTSFGARWCNMSFFMALLSLAEFIAEVGRFEGFRTAGRIALFYALLNRVILMPAWIISLGVQLPRAVLKQTYSNHGRPTGGELALSEMSSAVENNNNYNGNASPSPSSSTNPFSIDDGDDDQGPTFATPPPNAFAKP